MQTIVINAILTTVAPLSIALPTAEGQQGNKFNNFPLLTRGLDSEGNKLQTGYLPATTVRGFLRRAIVTEQMQRAAAAGKHYKLQEAYQDLIGQDTASESKDDIDLIKLRQLREDNAVLDLFGAGLGIKSRLLVSHFMPTFNVLPEVTTGVRKDLKATDGVLDLISASDREIYLVRSNANSKRTAATSVVKSLEAKLRKAKKANESTAELDLALLEAQTIVTRHENEMGGMTNSSLIITNYYALPAGIELKGRLVIERARERDIVMLASAFNALSMRPILGAQSARGCGEISGSFELLIDGVLSKKISIGGWQAAQTVDFS